MNVKDLLGGIFLTGAGLATWLLEWPRLREALRTTRWPTIQGRVTVSEFETGPTRGTFMRIASGRAAISYQYELDGKERVGNRVFIGDEGFGSAYEAQRRTRHYYPGVAVEVFYDPADPSRAVLETGLTASVAWRIAGGALLLVMGVVLLVGA